MDDSLFHDYGRKMCGAKYPHDGSDEGRDGIEGGGPVSVEEVVTVFRRVRTIRVTAAQSTRDQSGPSPTTREATVAPTDET